MEFLKSVAEILDKFTKGQRMFVLAIILICATLITIGPSIIEDITLSEEEAEKKINEQKREILSLSSSVDSLSAVVRVNQMNCTNSILRRESEFIAMLEELKSESMRRESIRKLTTESYMIRDSIKIGGKDEIKPEIRKIILPDYEPLSSIIENMKKEIKGNN
jgi:hypothetical protein